MHVRSSIGYSSYNTGWYPDFQHQGWREGGVRLDPLGRFINSARILGECCKLPRWDPGQSPGCKRFLCTSSMKIASEGGVGGYFYALLPGYNEAVEPHTVRLKNSALKAPYICSFTAFTDTLTTRLLYMYLDYVRSDNVSCQSSVILALYIALLVHCIAQ